MVCERVKRTGSNRVTTACHTQAERKAAREDNLRDQRKKDLKCMEATMGRGGCANWRVADAEGCRSGWPSLQA